MAGFGIQFNYEGHSEGNLRREVPGGRGGESVSAIRGSSHPRSGKVLTL